MYAIQSSTFRPDNGSESFHQGHGTGHGVSSQTGDQYHPLLRRLAFTRSEQNKSARKTRFCLGSVSSFRSKDQCRKVTFDPVTGHYIHRNQIPTETGHSNSSRAANAQNKGRSTVLPRKQTENSTSVSESAWPNGGHDRHCSSCPTPHASNSNVPFCILAPVQSTSKSRNDDSHSRINQRPSKMVDRPKTLTKCPKHSSSYCDSRNRRFWHRLGRSHSGRHDTGLLESHREKNAHKQSRTSSCIQKPETLCKNLPCTTCPCQIRQRHCNRIHKQTRGYSLSSNVHAHMASPKMGRERKYSLVSCPYCRSTQHRSRSAESQKSSAYRVDPQHFSNCLSFSENGNTKHRSICLRQDTSTPSVLHMVPQQQSLGGRRFFNKLDRNECICLSSNMSHTKSSVADETPAVSADPHSSFLAAENVVSRSSTFAYEFPNYASRETRPSPAAEGEILPSATRATQTGSVATQQPTRGPPVLSNRGNELVAASIRTGTRKDYKCKYKIFRNWCSERGVNPSSIHVNQIVDFLAYLHDKNLSYRTICGYRSMLSHYVGHIDGIPISQHPLIKQAIRGIFNINPPKRKLPPKWDLGKVLEALRHEPYEPLSESSLKYISLKTCFLLAVCTAKRATDLSKFSIKDDLFKLTNMSVAFIPDGLLKQDRPSHLTPPCLLPAYLVDKRLCPVRTVREYLARTKDIRQQTSSFFITFGKPHHAASSQTISRWIVSLICSVCESPQTTGHSTRAVSSSWASAKGISLSEIMLTADWSSAQTFCTHYNFSQHFAHAVLSV